MLKIIAWVWTSCGFDEVNDLSCRTIDKSNLILQRDLVFRWDLEPNPDPDLHRFKDSDPSSICFCFRQLVFFFRDMSRWDTYQPFDPVPPTGDTIMEESWLLCLDEFMVRKLFQHSPAVLRIRIRTDPHSFWSAGSGSAVGIRIRRAKINHKSEENSSLEVLDVLFWGMKTSPVAWTSFMEA